MYLNSDLASLAKAAVSGDEAALDLLSWNKGGGKVKMSLGPQESLCFFVGGTNGESVDYYWCYSIQNRRQNVLFFTICPFTET